MVGTSTLFGGNMPFIEDQYERYLAEPASVGESWRAYFDKLRNGAADVAHAPVIDSFVRLAKERKAAAAQFFHCLPFGNSFRAKSYKCFLALTDKITMYLIGYAWVESAPHDQ